MDVGARRQAHGGVASRLRKLSRAVERGISEVLRSKKPGYQQSLLEALEDRRLLANTVIINEFVASNQTGYQDPAFPGQFPDWIELYNPTAATVDLAGWQLKANKTFTIPAGTSIGAGKFLVIAADGKNLTDPSKVLHTNFNLGKDGEYLGLLKPDSTVANEFAPAYPAQAVDISYGITQESITTGLIGPGAALKAFVPANGALGTNWLASGFDDSSWLSGSGGVGFDADGNPTPAPAGWNVHMVRAATGDFSNIAVAKRVLDGDLSGFTLASDNTVSKVVNINYMPGPHTSLGTSNALPDGATNATDASNALREEYAIRASAFVTIPAGTYTVGVNSDDGFQLTIPGVTFSNQINENYIGLTSTPSQLTYGAPRGASDTTGTFTLTSPLTTTITVDMYEQHGGDSFEVFLASGKKSQFDSSFQNLANGAFGWSVNTAANNPSFIGQFGLNLLTQMQNKNASAYVRIPFEVDPDDLPAFQSLLLHMKYDDGFVAWINGQQVAAQNNPTPLAFNSSATGSNPDAQAVVFQDFPIPNAQTYLHAGVNILTIQAMNASAADSDFLNVATLDALSGTQDVERFFTPPTPGAANTGAYAGQVADTKFDHDRGFYTTGFQLVLSTQTSGATIRYTTDGSTPSATTGRIYTTPIPIAQTSTIRAIAVKPGYLSTNVDTQTYIFLDDVITQSASNSNSGTPPPGFPSSWSPNVTDYGMDPDVVNNPLYAPTIKNDLQTIPSLSIVTDSSNLFGPTGLYSNPGGSGINWERPASLELINPDGSTGFQTNFGLRLRGGYSRSTSNPKHGLRVLLRPEYGSSTLDFPLFKSMDGADSTRGFDIRTFENYSWSFDPGGGDRFIGLRDQFSRDTQYAMGWNAERGDMYNLYINGQYWGIYNTDERPEADYGATYFGGDTSDYDTIKVDPQSGYTIVATDGNTTGWNAFWNLANQLRTAADNHQDTTALYQQMQGNNPDGTRNPAYPVYLDAKNLIDYMMVIFYGGNLDAPISNFLGNTSPNNFYALWNHTTKDMGFQFFAHDSEHTLLDANVSRLGPFPAGSDFTKSNPQWIFQQLLYNPEFRLLTADRVHKYLFNNGALTPQQVAARFNKRRDEINRAIVGESARWGDSKTGGAPYTYQTWENNINTVLNTFFPSRTGVLLGQFRNTSMGDANVQFRIYPTTEAPEFKEQFGGNIAPGFVLHLNNPNGATPGTIYYTIDGSDPRLVGGAVSPSALVYDNSVGITLSATTRVQARILKNGVWSAITDATFNNVTPPGVRITEINYHPADPPAGSIYTQDDFEYVEIQNITAAPINLKNFAFADGITFTFPDFVLAPGAKAVVVANIAAFQSRYGTTIPIIGRFTGQLDNGGEHLQFNGPLGETVESFSYKDSWYPQTDGEGFSLVLRDPNQAVSLADTSDGWRASNAVGGDPGTDVATLTPDSIVVNEIAANVATPGTTWIELRNTTGAAIDLSNWFLSNDAAALKKYQFPAGTIIPANGYLVLNEQTSYGVAGNAGVLTPFTFDADGLNTINLSQADATGTLLGYRVSQGYTPTDLGQTLGRVVQSTGGSDFLVQTAPTPGADNAGPVIGPVVINEVMYGPVTGFGATLFPNVNKEYIELRNITNQPVALFDAANPANTWKIAGGLNFTFPQNVTIPAFGYVILTNITPTAFRSLYPATPAATQIFGPISGFLDNAGDRIIIQRPGIPEASGTVPYITVDRLSYDNHGAWPTTPNETGPSLIRKSPIVFGDDASNWQASPLSGGSPGKFNFPGSNPSLNQGANGRIAEGSPFDSDVSFTDAPADIGQVYTATVTWGDGQFTTYPNVDFNFAIEHTYANNGVYTVQIVINDDGGGTASGSVIATVTNVTPAVNVIDDQFLPVGGTLNVPGTFTDPGADIWSGTVDWDYHPGDTDAEPLSAKSDRTFLLNHVYDTAGTYVVRVTVSDNDAATGAKTFIVTVGDTTPPTVTASQFEYQVGPRSISITFSEDVSQTLLASALTVHNVTANLDVPTTLSWDAPTKTATWTFASLADGNYTATLNAADLVDRSGNPMAQNFAFSFYFLNGDANRDRAVDFNDLVILAQNYNTSGKDFAQGDFNGDGSVDFNDLVILAQRYNTQLAADVPQGSPALTPIAGAAAMPSSLADVLAAASKPTETTPPAISPPPPTTPRPAPRPVSNPPRPVSNPPKPVVSARPTPKAAPKVTAKPAPVKPVAATKAAGLAPTPSVFGTTRISAAVAKKRDNVFDL